jgi:hypothetical protein
MLKFQNRLELEIAIAATGTIDSASTLDFATLTMTATV